MTINYNQNPYYNDFDEDKKFHQILFVPGRAVQARELTQIQDILQKQVERFGDHVFEDGSKVSGGELTMLVDTQYVKLKEQYSGVNINVENYENQIVLGQTSGARGKVIKVSKKENGDPPSLFVQMLSGDSDTTASSFVNGENILTEDTSIGATLVDTDSTGNSSLVGMNTGIFYALNSFVMVDEQIIILDKYSNTPSYRVGLQVYEKIIDENDDESLLDPAQGTPNYSAPGAHRKAIYAELTKKRLDFSTDIANSGSVNFIELIRIENGIKTKEVKYSEYSELEKNLARRTYDESGDYTVSPFGIDIQDNDPKLNILLEPGKAYVRGYEFETIANEVIETDKGRDTSQVSGLDINTQYGNYCLISNISGEFNPTEFEEISLLDSSPAIIGTANVRFIMYDSGSTGSYVYRMYLFNIQMDSGHSFKDVVSIENGSGSTADIDSDGIDEGETVLFGTDSNTLLFQVPHKVVKTLKPSGVTDTDFTTQRGFDSVSFSSGTASINLTGSNTFFGSTGALSDSTKRQHYIVVLQTVSNAGATGYTAGDIVEFESGSRSITLGSGNQTATFDIDDSDFSATAHIISTINLNTKNEKVKTLVTGNKSGLTLTDGKSSLSTSDIFRITSITDTGDGDADVTDRFRLDNGQRDNLYDHGAIILKSGQSVVGPLDVDFEYFVHSGSGYCSVDSYSGEIDYSQIYSYTSKTTGDTYELRDMIDFRPRREDDGSGFDQPSVGMDIAYPNYNLSADYEYYLPRIDKVVLRKDREFGIIKGKSNLNPVVPPDRNDAMTLYQLTIPAYTFNPNDVIIKFVDNKRFTMRDIGQIEKRISAVEKFASLSLIERETTDRTILDSVGDERFKNGILVDSFKGHSIGDVNNVDYRCSVDFQNQELRAPFETNALQFSLESSTNLTQEGDLIVPPYTSVDLINQALFNGSMKVNPFSVSQFNGDLSISPSSDVFYDTETNPSVAINEAGQNDAWVVIGEESDDTRDSAHGTQYNDWLSNWAGQQQEILTSLQEKRVKRSSKNSLKSSVSPRISQSDNAYTIKKHIGNKVVDKNIVPYMRSIYINFDIKGMKPNTKVYAFFDDVNVGDHITPTGGSAGDDLYTDSQGNLSGIFLVPSGTFKTGSKLFRFIDNALNNITTARTVSEKTFHAAGLLNRDDKGIISTKALISKRQSINSNKVIDSPIVREQINGVDPDITYRDPLAQNFVVDSNKYPNGVYIKSIDLYFKNKDNEFPISLEIRPTVNGIPSTSTVVPHSQKTLFPGDIYISDDASFKTTFEFDNLVYLPYGEYSIVLNTVSKNYEVFTGKIGELQFNSDRKIVEQPYVSNLFEGQNTGRWDRNIQRRIKFSMKRASFDTGLGTYEAVFVNDSVSEDINMDTMYLLTSDIIVGNTDINYQYKAMSASTETMNTEWQNFVSNENHRFDEKHVVKSSVADTLQIKAIFDFVDDAYAPVIDTERFSTFLVSNKINDLPTDDVTELEPSGGDALARYITRRVTLEDGFNADSLKVFVDAYKPNGTDIRVYYKVLNNADSDDFDDKNYVEMDSTGPTGFSIASDDYIEYEYTADNITYDSYDNFKVFAIKIVMTSINTSDVPTIKNLKALALT